MFLHKHNALANCIDNSIYIYLYIYLLDNTHMLLHDVI